MRRGYTSSNEASLCDEAFNSDCTVVGSATLMRIVTLIAVAAVGASLEILTLAQMSGLEVISHGLSLGYKRKDELFHVTKRFKLAVGE